MDKLKWVCSHYQVNQPHQLIGLPGDVSEAMVDHLQALSLMELDQEVISKLDSIRVELAKINHEDESETIFGRYIWLKEAKGYCENLYNQYYKSGLLGQALKNDKDFKEPVGFLKIRQYVFKKFYEYEDQYVEELKDKPYWKLPEPEKIAGEFCNRPTNISGKYKVHDITPVMRVAADYIFEKKITDINRHVKAIVDACSEYAGSNNAKRNWVEFYARNSGLKVPVETPKKQ